MSWLQNLIHYITSKQENVNNFKVDKKDVKFVRFLYPWAGVEKGNELLDATILIGKFDRGVWIYFNSRACEKKLVYQKQ